MLLDGQKLRVRRCSLCLCKGQVSVECLFVLVHMCGGPGIGRHGADRHSHEQFIENKTAGRSAHTANIVKKTQKMMPLLLPDDKISRVTWPGLEALTRSVKRTLVNVHQQY